MKEMNDIERLKTGAWMNGFTGELFEKLKTCESRCFKLNTTAPEDTGTRARLVKELLGGIGQGFTIHSPFHCDFGFNISIGDNFVGNFNLTILDEAPVEIGDNVFIGPNVTIATIIHSLDAVKRKEGIMRALPVKIGNDVWIASGVTILPGVTIGDGAVIGAGSVVCHDVGAGMVAFGNPCREIRPVADD